MKTTAWASSPCKAGDQKWCARCKLHVLATVLCLQQNTMWRCRIVQSGESRHPSPVSTAVNGHACPYFIVQEDAHVARMGLRGDPDAGIFAVFDGHCGTEVSRFAARYLVGQCKRIQGIHQECLDAHTH